MSPGLLQRGAAADRQPPAMTGLADEGTGLAALIAGSPHMAAQRPLFERIHNSPRMAIQRRHLERQPVQLTVYKIASLGPEHHETDPRNYADRTGDKLEAKSLHQYKPGEIDLAVATSPITIFIHGGSLAKFTARKFYVFLEERGYRPKPDTEIVFITCHGADQVDEFLVEKGQALADLLGATVHLAKGIVRINAQGVPIVEKPDRRGKFPHIESEEELARIIPKETEGWKSYQPQGITYDMLRDEIRNVRRELATFAELQICQSQAAKYDGELADIMVTLQNDRRDLVRFYRLSQSIRLRMRESFQPRLLLFQKLGETVKALRDAMPRTERHRDRAEALAAEYAAWSASVASGRGDLAGFESLYTEKKGEWLDPLYRDIEHEEAERAAVAWGIDDDWLDELSLDEGAKGHGDAVTQTVPDDGRAPLQAKIDGGDLRLHAHGAKTAMDVLAPLADMKLVLEGAGLDLLVERASLDKGTHGLTTVWADGVQINPHVDIVPETAPHTNYTIRIQLSDARELDEGSVRYTLAHEWELHGRQHARNVARAKKGSQEMSRIDHVDLFNPASTDLDAAVAHQIMQEKDPAIQQQIFNAYLKDVFAHVIHLQAGWLIKREATRNVHYLLENVRSAVNSLNSIARFTVQESAWAVSVRAAAAFAKEHADELRAPEKYARPTDLPMSAHAAQWIQVLAACVATPPPPDEVLEVWFTTFGRPSVRNALIYLHELSDYLALPVATRMDMSAEDDKEAWKEATLLPRMRKLERLGVDVVALNRHLNLREEGADAAAHDGPVHLPQAIGPQAEPLSIPEFLETDWNALFLAKWHQREVEFIPADQIGALFGEREALKFNQIGDGRVTDQYRFQWTVEHFDDQRQIYYLKVGWD